MKKSLNKLIVAALFLISTVVCLYYSAQKKGMFIDEIYTYGLSNSEYSPFVTDLAADGNMVDHVLTRQQFNDYLTVQAGEQFHFGSVYYNQTMDVHPPLHYFLLHFVSSFFPNSYSKWLGLSINIVLFLLTLLVLYKMAKLLFEDHKSAAFFVALYGLSTIAVSTVLMIRMYMLLTFLTVVLAYLIACDLRKRHSIRFYLLVTLTIFLGLLTQYYYVFYAFFVCAAYDIYLLIRKEYKTFAVFSIMAFLGVGLFVLAYPACLKHLFADRLVSGGSMLENLKNTSDWGRRLHTYLYGLNHASRWVSRTGKVAAGMLVIVIIWNTIKKRKINLPGLDSLIIIIPAFVAFFVVAVASPVIPLRYIYNIVPMLFLPVAFLIALILGNIPGKIGKAAEPVFLAIITVMTITVFRVKPEFLYTEQAEENRLVAEHAQSPCVYFDNNFVAPITDDMLQLIQFEDVFVANDPASADLHEYLNHHKNNNEVVVYVDDGTEPIWSSMYDEQQILTEFIDNSNYDNAVELYDGVWLLTKKD